MKLKVILLIGLSIILMGCQMTANQKIVKPTKPKLTIIKREDGGMCLNKEDTSKLGSYILELERVQ